MRRFFSFRSSASGSGNSNSAPSVQSNDDAQWVLPRKKDVKISNGRKVREGSLSPLKQNHENEGLAGPQLRRSVSYSYPLIYCDIGEGSLNPVEDISPLSCGNSPHHVAESPNHCNSLTPERHARTRSSDLAEVRKSHAAERTYSPNSSRGYPCSSGNSPYSSPISLRCRAARVTQVSNRNKILDVYIDGEHHDIKFKKDSQHHSSDAGDDGCLLENRAFINSGRPPRAQSTAPSSPTFSKENIRNYSFREAEEIHRHLSTRDWAQDGPRAVSPQKYFKKNSEKLSLAYPGKSTSRLGDYDSETTATVEDIYEDSSDAQVTSHSNGISRKHSFDLGPATENISCSGVEESLGFQRQSYFLGNGSMCTKNDFGLEEQDADEELLRKDKEVEQKLMLLSEEDLELDELRHRSFDVSVLLQTIRNVIEDRRCLAVELSSQIKSRLAERSSAKEGFRRAKIELDTRTRRLEREKNELQLTLEKELDRRSSDWSLKLEKFQSEEQRLRERVRELAEQNVSLQREISSLKGNELDHRSRIMNSEMQLNDLTTALEESRTENQSLHRALSDLQERFNGLEEDLDCIRRNYKVTEKENKDSQKLVVRLQRICSEQDKTINGLRQGFSDEIGKQSDRGDNTSRLQIEQLRLASVEQTLRREVESCRHEIESLRHENICLLDRLKGTRNGCEFSVKLDSELCAQVDCLQAKGLSLLNDGCNLCRELLGFLGRKRCDHGGQETKCDFDEYSVAEYAVKYQALRRGIENFGRTLQMISLTLDEKSSLEASGCHSLTTEAGRSRQSKGQLSEDQLEFKLKAETLLTGLLREKLFSKELELEQMQADLASSVKSHDILRSEIQRLQDDVSSLSHKTKDMELQILKKDESINQLQHDLQDCTKELVATRAILMKVTEERDHMWEEVKRSKETIMLLNHEVNSLKKKIEALDEDVLIKEGQISILKDSLADRPFDTIYSPKSVKEFTLE